MWDQGRCKNAWASLELDPRSHADNSGPSYSTLRLYIPSWMVGTDKRVRRDSNYEDRALHNTLLSDTELTAKQQHDLVADCQKGFHEQGEVDSAGMKKECARGNSLAAPAGANPLDILKARSTVTAAGSVPSANPFEADPSLTPQCSPGSSPGGDRDKENQTPKKPRLDIGVLRTEAATDAETSLSKEVQKMSKSLKTCSDDICKGLLHSVTGDTFDMTVGRYTAALKFLGKKTQMNEKGEVDYSHNDGLGVDDTFGPQQPSSTAVPDVAAETAPGDASATAPAPEATEAATVAVDAILRFEIVKVDP